MSPYDCKKGSYISPEDPSLRIEYENTYPYPMVDIATIKIDKMTVIDNPQNRTIGIKEGDEATVRFSYNARPTIIRKIPALEGIDTRYGGHLDYLVSLIKEENGYFVYNVESVSFKKESEIILSGLGVGSKFMAKVSILHTDKEPFSVGLGCRPRVEITIPPLITVDEYEIMP